MASPICLRQRRDRPMGARIDDSKAYVKPWTNTIPLVLLADTDLLDSYSDSPAQILKTWTYPKAPPELPSPR